MKAILLCGGRGTRLGPLTRAVNKQLLPAGGEPLVYHPIRRLVEACVRDILVIVGPEHSGQVMNALRDGTELGARLTYAVQLEPKGIAHAISLGRAFVGQDRFIVMLGDNVFGAPIVDFVDRTATTLASGRVLLQERAGGDLTRFGVAELDGRRVVRIVEKPAAPPSSYAVIGLYGYTSGAFHVIESLRPSARGELEVTDLNNALAPLDADVWTSEWIDAGTPQSLRAADDLLWRLRA